MRVTYRAPIHMQQESGYVGGVPKMAAGAEAVYISRESPSVWGSP